jgi:Trypsin-like peptidase domain
MLHDYLGRFLFLPLQFFCFTRDAFTFWLYSVITDADHWGERMGSLTSKIGRVMHDKICYGTCFAVKDIDEKYSENKTKIILTARHCVYSDLTCTIPINYGLYFTFGDKSFNSPNVTHLATAKNLDLSAFRVEDPCNHIKTFDLGTSTAIYQCQQIFFGGYPDATDGMDLHREQPKYCFGRVSSYRTDDYRVTCTINSCLPNHSGSPVIAFSDERGERVIGMHIESLIHSDDSNKLDNEEVSEDLGGIVVKIEEIDLDTNVIRETKEVFKSPDLDRLKQRAKYSEDNVVHKTSMGIFVQSSALSLFYHTALDIPMRNVIKPTSSNAKKRFKK